MIGKVVRGDDIYGLLYYLFKEGRKHECGLQSDHVDPHLVASWEQSCGDVTAEQARDPSQPLALSKLMGQPLYVAQVAPESKPVWHLNLRCAPEDRVLTDAEWADVCEEILDRTGLAPRGDTAACRWAVVRHADDHVHLAVTLAREDGKRPRLFRDFYQVGEVCREMEEKYGLRRTSPRDRTADKALTRGEIERGKRAQWKHQPRMKLLREVRDATAMSAGPEEWAKRLRDSGVLLKLRYAEDDPARIVGYSVALPGKEFLAAKDGRPVYFGGYKLAPDLTMPKLLARWGMAPAGRGESAASAKATAQSSPKTEHTRPAAARLSAAERSEYWQLGAQAVAAAAEENNAHPRENPAFAADAAWGASDLLSSLARVVEGDRRTGPLRQASDHFARAAREVYGRVPAPSKAGDGLRRAGRLLGAAQIIQSRETAQLLHLVAQMEVLTDALVRLRENQERAHQAAEARAAAEQLQVVRRDYAGVPAAGSARVAEVDVDWISGAHEEQPHNSQGRDRGSGSART